MTLGPFLFGAPFALLGLIALPVIWYILRATPPAPKEASLPSLRLLDDLVPRDETPARTPWWILALRMIAAAADNDMHGKKIVGETVVRHGRAGVVVCLYHRCVLVMLRKRGKEERICWRV